MFRGLGFRVLNKAFALLLKMTVNLLSSVAISSTQTLNQKKLYKLP